MKKSAVQQPSHINGHNKSHSKVRYSRLTYSILASAISLSLLSPITPSYAATINVTGDCSLIEAINEANTTANTEADCDDGDAMGTDVLVMDANSSLTLTAVNNTVLGQGNGLPAITSSITIMGNGSSITRAVGAPAFRFFIVNSALETLTLDGLTLSNGTSTGSGGAIHSYGSLVLSNTILDDNTAAQGGGAISSVTGTSFLSLENCTVSNNSSPQDGGGILANGINRLTLDNTTVSGNSSGGSGGGIRQGTTSFELNSSTISGNTATQNGGGILITSTLNAALNNSTISGNFADLGGGIYLNSSTVSLNNSTLANNSAGDYHGAGIRVNNSNWTLSNSLFDNQTNTNLTGNNCSANGSTQLQLGNNWLSDDTCTGASSTGSSNLGPLQDNGGSTFSHALLAGSEAIGGGNNTQCLLDHVENKDQRGQNRPVGLNCDIGAYEYLPPPVTLTVNASCSLYDAMLAANTNLATGGCPAGGGNDTIVLTASSVLSLSSSASADGANRLPSITSTVTIDGNGSSLSAGDANPHRFFHIASNGELTLNQLTLTGGEADAGGIGSHGGAILNRGVLTLNETDLTGNSANEQGGALYNLDATANLNNSSLLNNHASNNGGGMANKNSSITLSNSEVVGNTATDNGGGLFLDDSELDMSSSTLYGNVANKGGALYQTSTSGNSTANISTSQLYNNQAADGGAVFNTGAASSFSLHNSSLFSNIASNKGGAIYLAAAASANISNSTLSGNSAASGAGIYLSSASAGLTNSTLSDNSASVSGGAILLGPNSGATLANSLLANSPSGGDCALNATASINADSHNLIEDGSCSTASSNSVLTGDPQLGSRQNNGGSTPNHAPQAGSKLFDAGDNSICAASPIDNLDQRGEPRPAANACDIGAVELGRPSISIADMAYTEQQNAAAPAAIDGSASISDINGDADWNGGKLAAQITANPEPSDELSLIDNAAGIHSDGTNLFNVATLIGTLSSSEGTVTGNAKLTITFNSAATNALVQATLRALAYRSSSDDPTKTNATRELTVTATDKDNNTNEDTAIISIAAVNDAPVFTSSATFSFLDGNTSVGQITATDPEGDGITFSLNGGADAGKFNLTAGGLLTFIAAPDIDNPNDDDTDNEYIVIVRASDGNDTTDQTISIKPTALAIADMAYTEQQNAGAPVIVDQTAIVFDINGDADWNGGKLEIQISANAEASDRLGLVDNANGIHTTGSSLFDDASLIGTLSSNKGAVSGSTKLTISFNNAATNTNVQATLRALTYRSSSDDPTRNNATRVLSVISTDKNNDSQSDTATITITGVNDAPVITSPATYGFSNGNTAVGQITATDAENDGITFSFNGGIDDGLFTLSPGGLLTFTSAPNTDNSADDDNDNEYLVIVRAFDGNDGTDQAISISPTDLSCSFFVLSYEATSPENPAVKLQKTAVVCL